MEQVFTKTKSASSKIWVVYKLFDKMEATFLYPKSSLRSRNSIKSFFVFSGLFSKQGFTLFAFFNNLFHYVFSKDKDNALNKYDKMSD
jgi:hypothetical protein